MSKNFKLYSGIFLIFLVAFVATLGCSKKTDATGGDPVVVIPRKVITTQYQEDPSNFANPERGLMSQQVSYSNSPAPFSQLYLDQLKSNKVSLVRKVYIFNTFKAGPVSESFLQHVQDDLNFLRTNGFKIILRFAYTFNEEKPHIDAPLNIVLSHIDQIKPILQNNADVIALMEGGFIGEWGEWHDSSNGLATTANMKPILFKLLDALPKTRTVAVRYQDAKKKIYETDLPLGSAEAYDLSNRSRTGHHNDCFVAAVDDWGTYWPIDAASLKAQKDYLNQENKYLPQVGETCNCNPPGSDCAESMKELERMRWSAINRDFVACVINSWVSGGCYDQMGKRLGYRFRLISSEVPNVAKIDSSFSFSFTVKNDGFATPYNTRDLELILRSKSNGSIQKFKLNFDPRTWLPDNGEIKISANINIPGSITTGEFEVLLNLPDPYSTLKSNPAYSIRLANMDVWEPNTGFNSLRTLVKIIK